ncbi:hypothetical protein A4A49_53109 [Nicotiana attenuata]|uniref:Uncharacterized protein n=1 Tax=Nicotiana attenuata TaxID=49451 RepID=A0A314KVE9_NICAT|nr:hypothetical protein A4A49_53109 [Nicotiana attenuata]
MNHISGRKSFQAISYNAVRYVVNAAFVKFVGEKSGYCHGQGSVIKPASRRSMHVTQEQLQPQQKETGLPAAISDMIANLNDTDKTSPTSLVDDTMVSKLILVHMKGSFLDVYANESI